MQRAKRGCLLPHVQSHTLKYIYRVSAHVHWGITTRMFSILGNCNGILLFWFSVESAARVDCTTLAIVDVVPLPWNSCAPCRVAALVVHFSLSFREVLCNSYFQRANYYTLTTTRNVLTTTHNMLTTTHSLHTHYTQRADYYTLTTHNVLTTTHNVLITAHNVLTTTHSLHTTC